MMLDPRMLQMGGLRALPNLTPMAQAPGYQAPPSALAQLLQRPGLREALMSVGSSLLQARDQPGATLGGALGRALPVGMQAYQRGQEQDRLNALIDALPPETQQLIRALPDSQKGPALLSMMQPKKPLVMGKDDRAVDPETYEELVPAAPDEPDEPDIEIREGEGGHLYAIDPVGGTGRQIVDPAGNPIRADVARESRRLGAPTEYKDPVTGEIRLGSWDPEAGRFVEVPGAEPIATGSEGERKAAGFLQVVPSAMDYIDSFEGTPGRVEQALSDAGLREFTSAEQQQLDIAGNAIAEAWLRLTSGAALTELEVAQAKKMLVPQPGDTQAALDMKKQMRQQLLAMLKTAAGRLAPQGSADPEAVLSKYGIEPVR